MKLRRALPWLIAAYFVATVACNAYLWHEQLTLRALEYRRFDYEWELQLPWRAAKGEWSAFDFVYPVGPLWQLLAWCGAALVGRDAQGLVAGQHLVFPLVSVLICGLITLFVTKDPVRRAVVMLGLCLLSLHDDVRSLRSIASVALVIAYVPLTSPNQSPDSPQSRSLRSWQQPALTALAWAFAGLLAFDNLVLGLASMASMAAAEVAASRRLRAPAIRLFQTLAVGTALSLAFALSLERFGNGPVALARGVMNVVRDYSITQSDDAGGFSVSSALFFLTLTLLPTVVFLTRQRQDCTTAMWLAGVFPGVFRGILRSDPEHVYASLAPLAAVLCIICVRNWGKRHVITAWSGLLSAGFILGWFGGHADRASAWQPTKIADALALRFGAGFPKATANYQSDLGRAIAWMRDEASAGASCISVPHGMGVAHPLADVGGPTKTLLRWSATRQKEIGEKLRKAACPRMVLRLESFDWQPAVHQWALGPDFVIRAQYYEPTVRLGPALFGARLRDKPLVPKRTPIPVSQVLRKEALPVPGSIELSFRRPIPEHHLIELDYEISVPTLRRMVGGMPWLEVQFFDGEEPLARRMLLPGLEVHNRIAQVLAPVPEAAEWHWSGVQPARNPRRATRMVIHSVARDASANYMAIRVHALTELVLSDPGSFESEACEADVDLDRRAQSGAFGRFTEATAEDGRIVLPPNPHPEPPAELFLPVRPCPNSCLFARVARESKAGDGAHFDVHALDGRLRPRLARLELLPASFPKALELPLEQFAGREALLRFAVEPGENADGDTLVIQSARVAPCVSRKSLIQELHQARLEVARGTAVATEDGISMVPEHQGSPPVDARLGVEVNAGDCIAFAVAPDAAKPVGVAIEVGVLESDVVRRLVREEFKPGETKPREFSNLPLELWKNKWVKLRFSAWPLGLGDTPRALVLRPRLHTCGKPAPWGSHGG